MNDEEVKPRRLGEILLQCGLVTAEQVAAALEHGGHTGLRLGEAMVDLGMISNDKITWALGLQLDLSFVDVHRDMINWEFLCDLPLARLAMVSFLPLNRIESEVLAVCADPGIPGLADVIQMLFPYDVVRLNLASEENIQELVSEASQRKTEVEAALLRQGELIRMGSQETPAASENRQRIPAPQFAQDKPCDLLDAILEDAISRVVVWSSAPDHVTAVRVDGSGSPVLFGFAEREQMSRRLAEEFVRDVASDVVFCGVRSQRRGGATAVRGTIVNALQGWAMSLARIPEDLPAGECLPHFAAATTPDMKRDLLGALADAATEVPPLVLEAQCEALHQGLLQAELAGERERVVLARRLALMNVFPLVVVEVETADGLRHAAAANCGGALLVLVRTPELLAEDANSSPADPVALVAAILNESPAT